MKSFAEKKNWHKEYETRKWKLTWHCIELVCISLSSFAIVTIIHIYGNGTKLQPIFMAFSLTLGIASMCIAPVTYSGSTFKRWHIQVISVGLGCGAGISAITAFLMLELQRANT